MHCVCLQLCECLTVCEQWKSSLVQKTVTQRLSLQWLFPTVLTRTANSLIYKSLKKEKRPVFCGIYIIFSFFGDLGFQFSSILCTISGFSLDESFFNSVGMFNTSSNPTPFSTCRRETCRVNERLSACTAACGNLNTPQYLLVYFKPTVNMQTPPPTGSRQHRTQLRPASKSKTNQANYTTACKQ